MPVRSLEVVRKCSALGVLLLISGCSYIQNFYSDMAQGHESVVAVSAPPVFAAQQHYAGDISASRVYVNSQLPVSQRMNVIDVRDASEYRAGHPEGARHLPYPRLYQQCQPHPFGAREAPIRSDDGGECRYGVVKGSEVKVQAADFWQAVQAALPYKDAPVAVLCRTRACAVDAANVMARPDLWVDKTLRQQGYTEVYVIYEGFVGDALPAVEVQTGRVISTEKKSQVLALTHGQQTLYGSNALAWDVNRDGKLSHADYGGWRNFLGLPYVVSMLPNLLSDAAQPYYERP